MNHKSIRVILDWEKFEGTPPDVKKEDELLYWSQYVYVAAMRTVAAGVLVAEGSLEKAASVLEWTGFEVPAGYFPEDHPADDLFGHDPEALQAWVEADAENIGAIIGTEVFRLSAGGDLLNREPSGFGVKFTNNTLSSE